MPPTKPIETETVEFAMQVGEWCLDASTKYDRLLLAAFEYSMQQKSLFAAPASVYDAAFKTFKTEVA